MFDFKYPTEWPQFYTAAVYEWKAVLADTEIKAIIVNSLRFLVKEQRIFLNAFVIMSNHIHLIWQVCGGHTYTSVKLSFMKFTAQQIKFKLREIDPDLLESLRVQKHDREYQIWKREPLSVELFSRKVFLQKLNYIHDNPVRAGLCQNAEDYFWSSASFYRDGFDRFGMLSFYE